MTWRLIPHRRELSEKYRELDAAERFTVTDIHTQESPLCRSGEVLQGLIKPNQCAASAENVHRASRWAPQWFPVKGRVQHILQCAIFITLNAVGKRSKHWHEYIHRPGRPLDLSPAPTRPSATIMGHGGGGKLWADVSLFLPALSIH